MRERFPVTLRLALGSFGVEVVVGLGLAIVAAVKRRTWIDSSILAATLVLLTIPVLVLDFVFQYVFGIKLGWFPVAGNQAGWTSYVLPSIAIGIGSAAALGRLGRSNILDNMGAEHIRAANARGLPRRRVVGHHVLKNSLVPIVTIFGLDLAYLMGGAVITEAIFNLPGLGRRSWFGIRTQNGPLVVGLVMLSSIFIVFSILIVDLLCAGSTRGSPMSNRRDELPGGSHPTVDDTRRSRRRRCGPTSGASSPGQLVPARRGPDHIFTGMAGPARSVLHQARSRVCVRPTRKPPSREHWFGTDILGCDYYTRVVYGARTSFKVGSGVASMTIAIVAHARRVSRVLRRKTDMVISRFADIFFFVPTCSVRSWCSPCSTAAAP